ncbi:AMP-binding protein [Geodermatophilus sp. DSM 45219]|uniref:AMP-binding protein n=1 Tax=Geodermatophilus sp. DSM 45219 TaxID=1881103 RepID=UPI00088DA947|nr:AMP-binding protein [Geodermatophilus sp. DSM 45219]SDO14497.1 Acyl-CoA synthetase (AMP-forming)/AMP-acid ligase II [Geodermatophilus sp. DSM 45219]
MHPPIRDVAAAADSVVAVFEAHADGALLALSTSGTTGRPRVVLRSTASWFDSFPHVSRLAEIDASSRLWVPGPLSATMNLFAAVHARAVAAALVATPEDATHAVLTPAALAAALRDGLDLRGRHLVVAGDRLPRRLACRAGAAGARVGHYYGAAELSFVGWGTDEEDLRPFPGVEVQVRGGRIWVRSPYVSLGYAGADGPFTVADDGFATVGDAGRLCRGVLTVTGRGTEAVLTGGTTVLVDDVEQALRPAAGGEVVVVGVPHARLGAVVAAVLGDPEAVSRTRRAAREGLPPAHRPRLWFSLPDPPLTAGGKVDRAAVAALAAAGRLPAAGPWRAATARRQARS